MSLADVMRCETLRQEIRRFAAKRVPGALREKSARHQVLSKDDYVQWMRLLQTEGWVAAHWPAAYGGRDWSLMERFVFEDELARLGLPWVIPFGVKYVGPVIYTFGTPEQKTRFLPRILGTEDFWAQGYSEPQAGSDLAALHTRAERDGDHYIVNGQKIWTTYAQWADWLFCLVRTGREASPQRGISFLLIDMKTPGITVKEIRTMDGYRHVNEVWFENVRVPVENRVGDEGAGWTCAKFLLQNERTAGMLIGMCWHAVHRLRALAGESLSARLRHRIGELELRLMACEETAYQAVETMMQGNESGAEASLVKLRGSEVYQDIAEALIEVLGPAGIAYDAQALHEGCLPPLGPDDAGGIIKDHLYNRALSIFGGTSEVQRNILAKVVLGL